MCHIRNNCPVVYNGSTKTFFQWKAFLATTNFEKSDTIVKAIKDSLVRFELPIQNLRDQTYNGGSNMMGKKSGLALQILKEPPKALITHCHGHWLSLYIKDTNKQCRIPSKTMGTTGEIIVLITPMLGAINENIKLSSDGNK